MRDYFRYDILYTMNITDIDDKIIKGARYEELFRLFSMKISKSQPECLLDDLNKALEFYKVTVIAPIFGQVEFNESFFNNWKDYLKQNDNVAMAELKVNTFCKAKKILDEVRNNNNVRENILEDVKYIICPWLDADHGHTINDNNVFAQFARKWEHEFLNDMKNLNVLPCDVLTRVSEYIPEIIQFIKVILERGFAYVLNGSVYFDVEKFNSTPGFKYAKLEPNAFNDYNLVSEAEGEYQNKRDKKKSPGDFALWKKSKPGEPSWNSLWGSGRPGWHIECSVMANDVSGKILDIHSGGIDLTFPHHDNELAQSEAYHNIPNWVRYFLHTGHLNIKGLKMSKSLKNFITIEEILNIATPVQIRILFLLSQWSQPFDYHPERLDEARHYENLTNNFLAKVNALTTLVKYDKKDTTAGATNLKVAKFKKTELDLFDKLTCHKKRIHEAFCDSFNTPDVMYAIRELIENSNSYISSYETKSLKPNPDILLIVSAYVMQIFKLLGIFKEGSVNNSDGEVDECFIDSMNEFSNFRSKIRDLLKEKVEYKILLNECDRVRDEVFPELGVQIDDFESGRALVKFLGKTAAIKANNTEQVEEVELTKKALKEQRDLARLTRELKDTIEPQELFKTNEYTGQFSEYDHLGIPTRDQNGMEISKSLRKKFLKKYSLHAQRHQLYLARSKESIN